LVVGTDVERLLRPFNEYVDVDECGVNPRGQWDWYQFSDYRRMPTKDGHEVWMAMVEEVDWERWSPAAIVVNGEWHEYETAKLDEWTATFKARFIDGLDPKTIVTVVNTHG